MQEPVASDVPSPIGERPNAGAGGSGSFDWSFDRGMAIAVLAFAGLVLFFTFALRPYDTFNLGIFLYEGSYTALGQNAYGALAIPAPPNLQLLTLGAYLSYAASNYNLSGPVAFFKGINGVLAVLTALLVANMSDRIVPWRTVRTRVFVALLLSAPIFFFSFIHVQLDLFGIFWSLAGLYLFFFTPRLPRWDWLRILAALLVLSYAAYTYTIPIAFFPTLIIYEPTWRRRFLLTAAAGVSLAFYVLPYFFLFSYLPSNPIGLTGAGANSAYSLPFVLGNFPAYAGGNELIYLWVGVTILLPIVLRKLRVDVLASVILSLLPVFFVLQIYNGDEFIWLLPCLTLGLAIYTPRAISWTTALLSQLILLPLVVVFNFYDGLRGMGTGIYYLFYPQFSNGYVVWINVPQALRLSQVLMGIVFAVLLLVSVRIAWFSRKSPAVVRDHVVPNTALDIARESPEFGTRRPSRLSASLGHRVVRGGPAVVMVTLIVLLVAGGVLEPGLSATFQSDSPNFPSGMFLVHPPVNANLSYSTLNGGTSVELPPTNPNFNGSVEFLRQTESESVSLGLAVGITPGGASLYNTTIITASNLRAQVFADANFPSGSSIEVPTLSENISLAPQAQYSGLNLELPTYAFSGDSLQEYALAIPPSQTTTYSFLVHPTHFSGAHTVVWSIATGVETAELVAVTSGGGLPQFMFLLTAGNGTGGGTWIPTLNATSWYLVEATVGGHSVLLSFNGFPLGTFPLSNSPPRLFVGRSNSSGTSPGANSFDGWATAAVASSTPPAIAAGFQIGVVNTYSPVLRNWSGAVQLSVAGNTLHLSSDNASWTVNGVDWFAIGRLSPSTVSMILTVTTLTLRSVAPSSLLVPFLTLALLSPIVFVSLPVVLRRSRESPARRGR